MAKDVLKLLSGGQRLPNNIVLFAMDSSEPDKGIILFDKNPFVYLGMLGEGAYTVKASPLNPIKTAQVGDVQKDYELEIAINAKETLSDETLQALEALEKHNPVGMYDGGFYSFGYDTKAFIMRGLSLSLEREADLSAKGSTVSKIVLRKIVTSEDLTGAIIDSDSYNAVGFDSFASEMAKAIPASAEIVFEINPAYCSGVNLFNNSQELFSVGKTRGKFLSTGGTVGVTNFFSEVGDEGFEGDTDPNGEQVGELEAGYDYIFNFWSYIPLLFNNNNLDEEFFLFGKGASAGQKYGFTYYAFDNGSTEGFYFHCGNNSIFIEVGANALFDTARMITVHVRHDGTKHILEAYINNSSTPDAVNAVAITLPTAINKPLYFFDATRDISNMPTAGGKGSMSIVRILKLPLGTSQASAQNIIARLYTHDTETGQGSGAEY